METHARLQPYIEANPGIAVAGARISSQTAETKFHLCDPETRFDIGSISKVFTGILLCEAVQAALCELDSPLADVLPESAPPLLGRLITLRQLANHTSSLPRLPLAMYPSANGPQPYATWDRDRILHALSQTYVTRKPGTVYSYSNFGFAVLGVVLETLHRSSYGELVNDLTSRLGCPEVRMPCVDELRASGRDAKGREVAPWNMNGFAAAGGLTSTLGGLVTFAQRGLSPLNAPGLAESMVERTKVKKRISGAKGVSLGLGVATAASLSVCASPDSAFLPPAVIAASGYIGGPAYGLAPTIAWAIASAGTHAPIYVIGQRLGFGLIATGIAQTLRKNTGVQEMGIGWHVSPGHAGREMLWHNGGMAGYRSFLGLVAANGCASVVLAASENSVDKIGVGLWNDLGG